MVDIKEFYSQYHASIESAEYNPETDEITAVFRVPPGGGNKDKVKLKTNAMIDKLADHEKAKFGVASPKKFDTAPKQPKNK